MIRLNSLIGKCAILDGCQIINVKAFKMHNLKNAKFKLSETKLFPIFSNALHPPFSTTAPHFYIQQPVAGKDK